MRIKVIIPNSGMAPSTLRAREEMLRQVCRDSTHVSVDCISSGPESIESEYDEVLAGPDILRVGEKAQQDGFDAVVIYCASDPAVGALRERLSIPVVAPGRAAVLLASYLSRRFTYVTVLSQTIPRVREQCLAAGLPPEMLASVRSVDIPVSRMRDDLGFTLARLAEAGKAAIEVDGAECLVLGCLGMAGLGKPLQRMLGVPIVDPAFASIAVAEMLVTLGLTQSKISYPLPPDKLRVS